MKKLALTLLLLAGLPLPARAWWDDGHMVVAQIAYDRLTPATRAAVNKLVPLGASAKNNTFVTSACWADDLKDQGVYFYNVWHYFDTPIYDGVFPQAKADGDLLWAMAENARILKSTKASDYERARALRFLIHFVGDAHQPLHGVSRFAAETPKGDRGGNDFTLVLAGARGEGHGHLKNLHSFWDSAGGWLTESVDRPLAPAGAQKIAAWAAAAIADPGAPTANDGDFSQWLAEDVALSRSDAYQTPFKTAPSAEYTANTQRISRQRIAAAGRRLANLLEDCLKPA